ncbi:MAG: hypothetical protein Q8P34_09340, partial [Bacteroidota bacterium]|nr:hypothetical protein [Bacteroidota bacterium]
MISLSQDLQEKKNSLVEFESITVRVLEYLPNVLSEFKVKNGYKIHSSQIAGTTKYVRPINQRLFIYSSNDFRTKLIDFRTVIKKLKNKHDDWEDWEKELIDSVLYTIQ